MLDPILDGEAWRQVEGTLDNKIIAEAVSSADGVDVIGEIMDLISGVEVLGVSIHTRHC